MALSALKLLDGGGKGGKGDSKYREVAWKLDERGTMGENLVGICLLHGTAVHNQLAIKLMLTYPKMVNDIFISEDYYGQLPLSIRIAHRNFAKKIFFRSRTILNINASGSTAAEVSYSHAGMMGGKVAILLKSQLNICSSQKICTNSNVTSDLAYLLIIPSYMCIRAHIHRS